MNQEGPNWQVLAVELVVIDSAEDYRVRLADIRAS